VSYKIHKKSAKKIGEIFRIRGCVLKKGKLKHLLGLILVVSGNLRKE